MTHMVDNDRFRTLALAAIVVCSALTFMYAMVNPLDVWDMLGYAASVHSLNGVDPATLHSAVYADLKIHASLATYHELTASTEYRTVMSTNPEGFSQQIPFYKIRILYVLMLLAFTKVGLGIFEAMHFISAAFGSTALLVMYLGLRNHLHSVFWMVIPFVFYGVTMDFETIQNGGVDTFAFFWVVLTVVAYVRGHKLLLPLLALSVLVRTDLVIHAALMFGILLLTDKVNRRQIVLWGFASLAMYVSINIWAGNYGWSTLIYFVFVSDMSATHPEVYTHYGFTFSDYLGFIFTENSHSYLSKWLLLTLGTGLLSLLLFFKCSTSDLSESSSEEYISMQRLNIVGALCLVYVVLHHVLFPIISMRFYIGQCMFMVVSLFSVLSYIYSSSLAAMPIQVKKQREQPI